MIVARGTILDGSHPPGTIGGDSTAALIRKARDDEGIAAVVLRVDSGGGSGFASEVIRRELELTRDAGKPVVATNVGGVPEIVVNGETGVLVPAGDAESLAKAVIQIIDKPVLAREMGEKGRQRAEKMFSIEQNISQTEETYTEILSRNS